MERTFFHQVRDVFEGFAIDAAGTLHTSVHGRGVKVWYDDATREHYEAQLVRVEGDVLLEIGFHAEHPKAADNRLFGFQRGVTVARRVQSGLPA